MNRFNIFNQNMPALSLDKEQLACLVYDVLSPNVTSFEFGNLLSTIARNCVRDGIGLPKDAMTEYNEILDGKDKVRIREIIWDLIVLRYVTIGDYHNDSWPHLTVTELGKKSIGSNC